ncbi:hypothetical protein NL676_000596 [Syzygium grande]|nr:hypothetical protein NL676_000596 [Syzygium grande]
MQSLKPPRHASPTGETPAGSVLAFCGLLAPQGRTVTLIPPMPMPGPGLPSQSRRAMPPLIDQIGREGSNRSIPYRGPQVLLTKMPGTGLFLVSRTASMWL